MTTHASVKVDEGIDEVRREFTHRWLPRFLMISRLNHDAMQQTVDLLVNAGCTALLGAGTTGENYAMTMKGTHVI
jgi:Dihydrodipicolinate synthase/N-acetylneuraminate lyase